MIVKGRQQTDVVINSLREEINHYLGRLYFLESTNLDSLQNFKKVYKEMISSVS
jgi:hypothetical protein